VQEISQCIIRMDGLTPLHCSHHVSFSDDMLNMYTINIAAHIMELQMQLCQSLRDWPLIYLLPKLLCEPLNH
jgi:hypothetical protein